MAIGLPFVSRLKMARLHMPLWQRVLTVYLNSFQFSVLSFQQVKATMMQTCMGDEVFSKLKTWKPTKFSEN
jgi:hypothetical protein